MKRPSLFFDLDLSHFQKLLFQKDPGIKNITTFYLRAWDFVILKTAITVLF